MAWHDAHSSSTDNGGTYSSNDDAEESDRSSLSSTNASHSEQSSTRSTMTSAGRPQEPPIVDDDEGRLVYATGDVIHDRYEIVRSIGKGTYGTVVAVKDRRNIFRKTALKIARNATSYRNAAKREIEVLKKLAKFDPHGKSLCVKMLDRFDFHGHKCIAFEMLGCSVFDFMKRNHRHPFPICQVRHILYQLCYSVNFLHRNQLTHTDLKPENVVFQSNITRVDQSGNYRVMRNTEIQLIDFGLATFEHERHKTIVSSRPYRAPEVILKVGWTYPVDVWSLGCIAFELYKGRRLFRMGDVDLEHLAIMQCILGPLPVPMCRKSKTKYFDRGSLKWNEENNAGRYVRQTYTPLMRYMTETGREHKDLFDLIARMLVYEPSARITLEDALNHPFFERLPPKFKLHAIDRRRGSASPSPS